jgi:predicted nucleic acid-binding protein
LPVVSDSTALIWLSKVGKIDLLKTLYGEVYIPEEVYQEVVVRGLGEGFSDALVIKDSVDKGWVIVKKLDEEQAKRCRILIDHAKELHRGEAQAILIAQKEEAPLLMDESCGRAFAEAWGLKVHGTLYVILRGLHERIISREEATDTINTLVEKGFRIEPSLITWVIREIQHYKA